jgi:hypothetical protein
MSNHRYGLRTASGNIKDILQDDSLQVGRVLRSRTRINQGDVFFSDLFGMPAAGYSLRKLTPNAINCIRVRRSNDNAEQDIGFINSKPNAPINTGQLLQFVGANDGFITTWYNQGSVANGLQTTGNNQPQIVSSGVVELSNSLPSIKWDGSNDFLSINGVFTSTMNITTFAVVQSANVTINQYIYDNSNSGDFGGGYSFRFINTGGFRIWAQNANVAATGGSTANNTTYITSQLSRLTSTNTENNELWVNNSNVANNSATTSTRNAKTESRLGVSQLLGGFLNGKISELIAYDFYNTSERNAITLNINNYYNVF